jgi:hypothetical protein
MRYSVLTVAAVAALAGSAFAQITNANGYSMSYRNGFASFPGSTVSVNGGGAPASVAGVSSLTIRDSVTANDVGDFANRHLAFFSTDGGATPYALQAGESFSIGGDMRITNSAFVLGGVNRTPTVEGGPFLLPTGNPFPDGGMWVINNRTVFTAGAGSQFALLGEGNGSNPNFPPLYTPGGWGTFRYSYFAPGAISAGSPAGYQGSFTDWTSGVTVTTPLMGFDAGGEFPNGLPAGTLVNLRMMLVPIVGLDQFGQIEYQNIVVSGLIPTPASASLLAIGGLVALRRRR